MRVFSVFLGLDRIVRRVDLDAGHRIVLARVEGRQLGDQCVELDEQGLTRPPETGPEGMLGFWTLEGGRDGEEATYVGADYPEAT